MSDTDLPELEPLTEVGPQQDQAIATALAFKQAGNDLFKKGNFAEAITEYSKAIEAQPTNHIYYSNRSAAHFAAKDFPAALADAQEDVKLNPMWSKGHKRVVHSLVALDRLDEAVAAAKSAVDTVGKDEFNVVKTAMNALVFRKLKGKWHGKVSDEMGGFIQEFTFDSDDKVKVSVLDTSVEAVFSINASVEPWHFDLLMEQPGAPPTLVSHIFKLSNDDNEFHLVAPYMAPPDHRPSSFGGPAQVVMARGGAEVDPALDGKRKAAENKTLLERVEMFANEVKEVLPMEAVKQWTPEMSEEVAVENMSRMVRFQSKYHNIKSVYGEDAETYLRDCLTESRVVDASISIAIDELRVAMEASGLIPEEVRKAKEDALAADAAAAEAAAAKTVADAQAAAAAATEAFDDDLPALEPVVEVEKASPKTDTKAAGEKPQTIPEKPVASVAADVPSDNSMQLFVGLGLAAALGALVTFVLLRKK